MELTGKRRKESKPRASHHISDCRHTRFEISTPTHTNTQTHTCVLARKNKDGTIRKKKSIKRKEKREKREEEKHTAGRTHAVSVDRNKSVVYTSKNKSENKLQQKRPQVECACRKGRRRRIAPVRVAVV